MKTKALALLLLFVFLFIACPVPLQPPNPPIPPEPPIPPIEYVYKWICEDSQLLSREDCKKGIHTKFVKGTEPTEICKIDHNPIPPIVYPEVIEDIHAGFLGIHLWFQSEAWEAATFEAAKARLKETLHETRIRRIGTIDFFLWLSDGHSEHAHLNNKTPYLPLGNGSFDLSKWQDRYFELFEAFVIACKEHDIRPAPHLFMDRYAYGPFQHNINWIGDFWEDNAFPFQSAFAEKICKILDKHFDNYWIKPINEAAHYGNQDMFHAIGKWHERMWDEVLSKHIKIDRLIVDLSMSEGGQIYLNEPLLCGKPYEPGEEHGNPTYDRSDPTNSILAETHSISTIESFDDESFNFLISRWQRYKFHGDGSDRGSFQLADTDFRQGDAQETYEMGIFAWSETKPTGKRFVYSIFPMESFRDDEGNWNLWFENYNKNNIFWTRIDAIVKAWIEIYE